MEAPASNIAAGANLPVRWALVTCRYFTAAATALNVASRLVPTSLTAVMITTEMSAAIRPYSMAVAPLSSRRNAKIFCIDDSLVRVVGRMLSSLHGTLVGGNSERRMLRKPRFLWIFPRSRKRQEQAEGRRQIRSVTFWHLSKNKR